ncbi:MAG: DUF4442 domain-containing protein, partial [Saprospiraceae bacterium]
KSDSAMANLELMKPTFNHTLARTLLQPWKLRLWMIRRLPMGLATGMKVVRLDENNCEVILKDRPWIHNPFGSVFWAVMGMAAELTTGSLVYAWTSGSNIKFILTGVEGVFIKKLKGKSSYFCPAGHEVLRSLEKLEKPGDTNSVILPVISKDQAGQVVAEFKFTLTLKLPDK